MQANNPHHFTLGSNHFPNPQPQTRSYLEPTSSHLDSFSQSNSQLTPNHTQMIPKIVESGYVIGPPIAYTNQPTLPSNYPPFSPNQVSYYEGELAPEHSRINPSSRMIVRSPSNNQLPVNLSTSQTKMGDKPYSSIILGGPPVGHGGQPVAAVHC